MDSLQATFVQINLCAYVDDIAIHATGARTFVASTLARSTDALIQMLEDELCMQVSRRQAWSSTGRAKTVATVSNAALGKLLATPMRRMGIVINKKAKHLGIQFGPGGRTRDLPGAQSRWVQNSARRARTIRLGRRLGVHVFRTGLRPATMYGSTVAIPRIGIVRAMRKAAAKAISRKQARSVTARLTVHQCDPAYDAIRNPIMAWARECWTKQASAYTMKRAWMHAQTQVATSTRPSVSAGGAAGSFIAALHRLGWKSPSFETVRTREGIVLDLSQEAPRTVGRYYHDDYQAMSAATTKLLVNGGLDGCERGHTTGTHESGSKSTVEEPVPWFDPAVTVLNSKWAKTQSPAAVASAATLVEGGWWPQHRLFQKGLASHPFCKLCGLTGTLFHRLIACSAPARKEKRQAECPEWLAKQACDRPADPLFAHGVPQRPRFPEPPPSSEFWVGEVPEDGATASGEACTDGALRGTVPRARRAGWAFIVSSEGKTLWGKYGTCSERYTTVLRAELRALLEILRITTGPLTIHVDNKEVVDGVALGEDWCCDARRDGADIWRMIWAILNDLGELVNVVKVKAHLTYQHVLQGRISRAAWSGNAIADRWAKAGCAEACRLSPTAAIQAQWIRACAWYRWVVRFSAEWHEDTAVEEPMPLDPVSSDQTPPPRKRQMRPNRQHEIWQNDSTAWCRSCGITAPYTLGARSRAFSRSYMGNMGQRCKIEGREHAKSNARLAYDDGAIPLAVLHSKLAYRVLRSSDTEPLPGSDASGHGHITPGRVPYTSLDVPPEIEALPSPYPLEDEDPFGHTLEGFDNAPSATAAAPSIHAAPAVTVVEQQKPGTDVPNFSQDEDEDPFGHIHLGFGSSPEPRREATGTPAGGGAALAATSPTAEVPETQRPGAHASHALRRTAHLVWCTLCGRHAAIRLGVGLQGECKGMADGAYPARLARLRRGCHPISGAPI